MKSPYPYCVFIYGRGKEAKIDWSDVQRVGKCRWTNKDGFAIRTFGARQGQSLSHFILELQKNDRVVSLNGDKGDCRRKNMKVFRTTDADQLI